MFHCYVRSREGRERERVSQAVKQFSLAWIPHRERSHCLGGDVPYIPPSIGGLKKKAASIIYHIYQRSQNSHGWSSIFIINSEKLSHIFFVSKKHGVEPTYLFQTPNQPGVGSGSDHLLVISSGSPNHLPTCTKVNTLHYVTVPLLRNSEGHQKKTVHLKLSPRFFRGDLLLYVCLDCFILFYTDMVKAGFRKLRIEI